MGKIKLKTRKYSKKTRPVMKEESVIEAQVKNPDSIWIRQVGDSIVESMEISFGYTK